MAEVGERNGGFRPALGDSLSIDSVGNERFLKVCGTADVRDGHGKSFKIGTLDLAIFQVAGKFYATSDICSHEHEHLSEGWVEDNHIECPRHGAMFDLKTGEAISLPATEPIEVFDVEIRGNEIWVGIPIEYLEEVSGK